MVNIPNIFMDKIGLSDILLGKVFNTINTYNNIFRKIRAGELEQLDLWLDADWQVCWQNLKELYDYLEFEYIDLLEHKFSTAGKKGRPPKNLKEKYEQEKQKLADIIQKYKDKDQELTFQDLDFVYSNIRYITTKIGLHNVSNTSSYQDFAEPEGDWDFEI